MALVLRLALLAADPDPYDNSGLAANHGELARNVVDNDRWFVHNRNALELVAREQQRTGGLVDPADLDYSRADADPRYLPVVLQPIGAGTVLAGLWAVTGDEDFVYLQLLQIAIDVLMVLVVFWIALTLYQRRRTALIAAGLYSVFLPIAVLAKVPHLDIWAVHATISVTALALKAWKSDRPLPWLLTAGVVTGLGTYFRPGVLLVPVALSLASLPWIGWRRTLAAGLVPLVTAAALAVPWTIRNYEEFDRFIPMRTGVGQNLWEGLGEIDNDFGAVLDDQVTERQVREEDPSLVYGTPEYDDHLREKAVEAIQDHPDHAAKILVRRAFVTTVGLHNLDLPLGLAEPLLFVLSVAVAVATWRRFPRQNAFLAAVPLATLLPYLVLHVEPRYMLPASFAYLIWLALGVDLLLDRRAAGR